MKPVVVQKYGGSSVSDVQKIRKIAKRIIETKKQGYNIVAVVSAMGSSTDNLMQKARKVSKSPKKRELDMLLSVGERITMSLMTMAIQDMGFKAISFTGSQCGIITSDSHSNARIIDVRPVRIFDEFERDKIVIVAGFQGMSYKREVTTLGRGGSDTTAVALATALGAKFCEICSDVDGVYTSDPKIVTDASKIESLNYDEMEAMGVAGADVLNPDALEFARSKGMKIVLTSSFKDGCGTLLIEPDKTNKQSAITAVTMQKQIYHIKANLKDHESLVKFSGILAKNQIPTDLININNKDKKENSISIEISANPDKIPNWKKLQNDLSDVCDGNILCSDKLGTVSLIGSNLAQNPEVFNQAIAKMRDAKINWQSFSMSRNKLTFTLSASDVILSTKLLHDCFLLEAG